MGFRTWIIAFLCLVGTIMAADGLISKSKLDQIQIAATVDPPSVVADGLSRTSITIRITENGQPRVGDLVQVFLVTGSGRILPGWAYTDNQGMIVTEFTPNPYSIYDPVDGAELKILDISIGRIIEVGKSKLVSIPMLKP
jgi:hypothetical protein